MRERSNIEAALSFIRAVEQMDGRQMEGFFSANVEQVEMPNAFKPDGQIRNLAELKADVEKARGIIEHQRYQIRNTIASGNQVVLEMVWSGITATDLPDMEKGRHLRAQCVAVFEFHDGKVVKLRNYDCFDRI